MQYNNLAINITSVKLVLFKLAFFHCLDFGPKIKKVTNKHVECHTYVMYKQPTRVAWRKVLKSGRHVPNTPKLHRQYRALAVTGKKKQPHNRQTKTNIIDFTIFFYSPPCDLLHARCYWYFGHQVCKWIPNSPINVSLTVQQHCLIGCVQHHSLSLESHSHKRLDINPGWSLVNPNIPQRITNIC